MARQRALSFLILLTALCSCSKEPSPPTAQTPAQATPAPAPAPAQQASAPPAPTPAAAPAAAAVLKTEETNIAGVVAEVAECQRKDGVLSLKVRFRNTGSEKKQFNLISGRDYQKFYLTAASKKYFILKDTEGTYLTPQASGFGNLAVAVEPGGQYNWWAKYPAPPAEVKAVTFYMPLSAPLEDLPVSDK